jgi:C4-dicarboxylate transporter, DctM subunit
MYMGVFTATEAAGAGALAALLVAVVVYRSLGASRHLARGDGRRAHLGDDLHDPRRRRRVQPRADQDAHSAATRGAGHRPTASAQIEFLLAVMLLILILGMFLETISIILITTPVVLPVLAALGINPIWYGVLLMINLELALITPPVGMNLFTIKAIAKAPIVEIIRGAVPYAILLLLGLVLLLMFPRSRPGCPPP